MPSYGPDKNMYKFYPQIGMIIELYFRIIGFLEDFSNKQYIRLRNSCKEKSFSNLVTRLCISDTIACLLTIETLKKSKVTHEFLTTLVLLSFKAVSYISFKVTFNFSRDSRFKFLNRLNLTLLMAKEIRLCN